MTVVTINGSDPEVFDTVVSESFGLDVTGLAGWIGRPRRDRETLATPGMLGPSESSTFSTSQRSVPVDLLLADVALADRVSVVRELLRRIGDGTVELRFDDRPGQVLLARLEGVDVQGWSPRFFAVPDLRVRLDFVAYQPVFFDEEGRVASFTAAGVWADVLVGTAPTYPKVFLRGDGSSSNPSIVLRTFRGEEIASLDLTGTIAAGLVWEADFAAHTLTEIDDGIRTRIDENQTGGSWWKVEPEYQAPDGSPAQVRCAQADGWVRYRRLYQE